MPRKKKAMKIISLVRKYLNCKCPYCDTNIPVVEKMDIAVPVTDTREEIVKILKRTIHRPCVDCAEILDAFRGFSENVNPDYKIFVDTTIHGTRHSGYCSDHGDDFSSYSDDGYGIFNIPDVYGDPVANATKIMDDFRKFIKPSSLMTCQCCGFDESFDYMDIIKKDEIESRSRYLSNCEEYLSII